ncbi:MAG: TolC family protein [Mariprofundaceae bacterium]|nr:TolC family protein [Mariprofundaceae bacterium]
MAEPVSLSDVLHIVLSKHPALALARIQEQSLKIEQQNIQGLLDPRVSLTGGLSDQTTPTTNPFAPSGSSSRTLAGNITKLLPDGSTVSASFAYSRSKVSYPASVPVVFQATINPTYEHQIDLIYRYPLLRGHGNPNFNEQISNNEYNEVAAHWNTAIQRELLAAQAISLYYQIASNIIAKRLAQDAVMRAKKLLIYQKKRQEFGLIETSDQRQTEALLAARNVEYSNANATLRRSITTLNRLMLREAGRTIQAHIENSIGSFEISAMPTWLEKALQQRPVFHMLAAQQAANDSILTIAHDQHDMQIDLISQVGSRALSASYGRALGQGFTLNDRFISIGFEFKDTLNKQSSKAAILQAELSRERIRLQRQQALEDIETELSTALTLYQNGTIMKKTTLLRQQAEQLKFNAEMARYQDGRSDTATLIQFEGDLRNAELQAALQDIQIQLAEKKIALATGNLLHSLDMNP